MPRSVLKEYLTGSVSLVVVVAVVMVFHQTTPIQHEQTVIQAVYQLICKVKESVYMGIRRWEVVVFSSLVQYISSSKQRIYIPNRVNNMENVFITYLVFSFLRLLFLLCGYFMELLRQIHFGDSFLTQSTAWLKNGIFYLWR